MARSSLAVERHSSDAAARQLRLLEAESVLAGFLEICPFPGDAEFVRLRRANPRLDEELALLARGLAQLSRWCCEWSAEPPRGGAVPAASVPGRGSVAPQRSGDPGVPPRAPRLPGLGGAHAG